MIFTSSLARPSFISVSSSFAVVLISTSGLISTVWSSSSMSSWVPTSLPVEPYTRSNTTNSLLSFNAFRSKVNVTLTVPLPVSEALKVAEPVTSFLSTKKAFPVSLSIKIPSTLYCFPGIKFS